MPNYVIVIQADIFSDLTGQLDLAPLVEVGLRRSWPCARVVYISAQSNLTCSPDDEVRGGAYPPTDMLPELPDLSVTLLAMVSVPDHTSWLDLRAAAHENLALANSPGFLVSVHDSR